jgi:serine/threonine protein kinase
LKVLSRKLPYYEYKLEAQVVAALARRQLPKRPSASNNDDDTDSEDLDEFDEPDEIDDPTWSLITHCCARKPEDRPNASRIQELIVDLKMWDNRSEAKDTNDTLLSLRSNPDVDLNRAGELLNELQVSKLY